MSKTDDERQTAIAKALADMHGRIEALERGFAEWSKQLPTTDGILQAWLKRMNRMGSFPPQKGAP